MPLGPSTYLINKWLDATFNNTSFSVGTAYVQLHVGDPGANGTANPATETTRKAISTGLSSGAAISSDADISWSNIAGSQDATHWSAWDAATSGNFLGSGTITANAYTAGDTFTIPAGDFDIAMTAAS